MATSDYNRPSCGQSFAEQSSGYSDLSHLPRGPLAGESMSAGNTSAPPASAMDGPGSEPVNPAPALSQQDRPDLDEGTPQNYTRRP